jgi:hypothetical protein
VGRDDLLGWSVRGFDACDDAGDRFMGDEAPVTL